MRNSTNTHTHRHTPFCIHRVQHYLRFFSLLHSHLWLFVNLTVHIHTDTHYSVINSITHTPVNANEAKTNPSLFMFCLCLNKKAFFLCLFIIGQIRGSIRASHYFNGLRRSTCSSLSWANVGSWTIPFIPLCLSCFFSCSLSSNSFSFSFWEKSRGMTSKPYSWNTVFSSLFFIFLSTNNFAIL